MRGHSPTPAILAGALVLVVYAADATAQTTYHVRTDGLFGARPGMALVTLQTDAAPHPWLSAEAMVWTGLEGDLSNDLEADALVMVVRARDPEGRGEMKLGRFVLGLGALRPIHIDGAYGRVNLPLKLSLEAYAGSPVIPRWWSDDRSYDWAAGTRVSRRLGDWGSVGLAYAHRRDYGELADEEIGLDAGGALSDHVDLNGKVSWDLITPGISEAHAAAVYRDTGWRAELFGWQRSASRILPATSLFAALGDETSRRVGLSGEWRVAPRLDLGTTTATQIVGDDFREALALSARLRLDPLGESLVGLEARREGSEEGGWTGARTMARLALTEAVTLAGDVEVALADEPGDRGAVWPWGTVALGWDFRPGGELAGTVQASGSPEYQRRLVGLVRLTHRLGSEP
ncbi:MAG: hypothetical protein CMH57_03190 [Myxococcales bacterium]|nr:hypothetical protein [Myxococcales bacterium]